MKTGILITNIGTPDAPDTKDVRRFLKEFLSDPRVVEIPRPVWWLILNGFILPFRPKQSAALYKSIWTCDGSPLLLGSKAIAAKLSQRIKMPVVVGMSYGAPSIKSALASLSDCDKIIVLPLFPQYSATTTAAAFDAIAHVFKKTRNLPSVNFIKNYFEHPLYSEAIANSIRVFWQQNGRGEHLLFSFHGIPERFIQKGDPYAEQCYATVKRVTSILQLNAEDWSLSFQSRLGRAKWLSPYTEETLEALPKQGIHHLQVVCPGFAVDCLETLEEIAIRGKEQFVHAGGKQYEYIPALNATEGQIDLLAAVIKNSCSQVF